MKLHSFTQDEALPSWPNSSGNADNAVNADGTPNTAHSLNPVPAIYVTPRKDAKIENGILADVAPSILTIMGLPIPAEMTGKVLVK